MGFCNHQKAKADRMCQRLVCQPVTQDLLLFHRWSCIKNPRGKPRGIQVKSNISNTAQTFLKCVDTLAELFPIDPTVVVAIA